jgi:hypothetical protein
MQKRKLPKNHLPIPDLESSAIVKSLRATIARLLSVAWLLQTLPRKMGK